MPLPVLTRVGTTAVVDRVATQELLVHQSSAYALRPANAMFACPRSCSTRRRESPIGTGSSQDHANEPQRCCLHGVALAFFSPVAGRDRPLTWLAHPLEFAPSQGAVLDFVWPVSLPAAREAEVIAPISKPPAAESKQQCFLRTLSRLIRLSLDVNVRLKVRLKSGASTTLV